MPSQRIGAIQEADEKLLSVIDHMPAAVAVVHGQPLVLRYANQVFGTLLKEPFECRSAVGRRLEEVLPDGACKALMDAISTVQTEGEPYRHTEFEFLSRVGGVTYWNLYVSALKSDGASPGAEEEGAVQIVAMDVTEQVEFNRQLLDVSVETDRERRQLTLVMENAPVALALVDTDLHFVRVNHRLASLTGKSIDAHIGRTISTLMPELAPAIEPAFRAVTESGQLVEHQLMTVCPASGGQRQWQMSIYPVRVSPEGKVFILALMLFPLDVA